MFGLFRSLTTRGIICAWSVTRASKFPPNFGSTWRSTTLRSPPPRRRSTRLPTTLSALWPPVATGSARTRSGRITKPGSILTERNTC